jgi:hypothetical protein
MYQFISFLESELSGTMEAQILGTVERAILLARVQEEVMTEAKPWAHKHNNVNRSEPAVHKPDAAKSVVRANKLAWNRQCSESFFLC